MDSLEKQLQKCEPDKVKLIVIDGVFSMEGDVAKLPEIVALAKKYNASVMVDEDVYKRQMYGHAPWAGRTAGGAKSGLEGGYTDLDFPQSYVDGDLG